MSVRIKGSETSDPEFCPFQNPWEPTQPNIVLIPTEKPDLVTLIVNRKDKRKHKSKATLKETIVSVFRSINRI